MNSSPQKLTIFLCHASEDKPKVRGLFIQLINDGYDVWLDEEKLIPGHDWRNEITKAVKASNIFIVCLSHNSENKEGFVQKEIRFALDVAEEKPENTIFIIPAKLEECNVPDRLSRWQWVDLFSENGYKKLKQALDLRYETLGKHKRKKKQSPKISIEDNSQSLDPINLAKNTSMAAIRMPDEKANKVLDSLPINSPVRPYSSQNHKKSPKNTGKIFVLSFLTLGLLFVFFMVLVFTFTTLKPYFLSSTVTPDPKPPITFTLKPDLKPTSTSTIQVSPTKASLTPRASSDLLTFTDQNNLLAFDLPGDWTYEHVELGDKVYSDADAYSDTFASSNGSAKMESLVIFSQTSLDNSISDGAALDLLHRFYSFTGMVGDILISSDQIMNDSSERFEWTSKGGGYSGRTYFEVRGANRKTWLMFTAWWNNNTDQETLDIIDNAIGSYRIP